MNFILLNSKTWRHALKSRDHRLATDRYECKTSFFWSFILNTKSQRWLSKKGARKTQTHVITSQKQNHNHKIQYTCNRDCYAYVTRLSKQAKQQTSKNEYGIRGLAHTWFRNYLTERTQQVEMDYQLSAGKSIDFGVPQGSTLGHLWSLIYVNMFQNMLYLYASVWRLPMIPVFFWVSTAMKHLITMQILI